MLDIHFLRNQSPKILIIGSPNPAIIQAILDFNFLNNQPASIAGIVGGGNRKYERYFWGNTEVMIKRYKQIKEIPQKNREEINFFLNMNSGRRAPISTQEALVYLQNIYGGVIFAENVTERDAVVLRQLSEKNQKFIIGPASVGILIPKVLKLGPVAGLNPSQLQQSNVFNQGDTAVFSASGGMIGELITALAGKGKGLSFALHFGGDRFPIISPKDAFLAAEKDPQTKQIVYYGELGGVDEYELIELIQNKHVTKPIYAYIAGAISEMFEIPPQFGHAKAMAKRGEESAQAKREALKKVGVQVSTGFGEFIDSLESINNSSQREKNNQLPVIIKYMEERKKKIFASSLSQDQSGTPMVLETDILDLAKKQTFGYIVASMLLGKKIQSKELEDFVNFVLKLLVDHGPYQSGVINTMITARAGRDMVSALTTGLLTIGPRFGGATNEAAKNWYYGVRNKKTSHEFVEEMTKQGKIIEGIGHLKYRADLPDPRVTELLTFVKGLKEKKYVVFAQEVEKVTTLKKGNLILNVDGVLGAILLDLLAEKEGYTEAQLEELIESEFFNALFILSRSVGFVSHYLDQKRIDEGLVRFSEEEVSFVERKD